MKTISAVILLLILATMTSLPPVFAEEKYTFMIPTTDEPIFGTWINAAYEATAHSAQKWVFYNWGRSEVFAKVDDKDYLLATTYILLDKTIDTDGTVWYKELDLFPSGKAFWLVRISPDRMTLEAVSGAGFPQRKDLKTSASTYRIYRRKLPS